MGAKSLVKKIIRAGYFWPSMQQDTADFVKRCDSCQRYGNVQQVPVEKMTTISSPWPFAQWGIDIMGPLPQGKRQVRFLLVAIDYFTKWVEAEALATITETKVQNFVWKNILCRFGIPRTIISDNGRQFDSHEFTLFSSSLGIKNKYSSPGHPQANGHPQDNKLNLAKYHQGLVSGGKGNMARGVTRHSMGLQDYNTNPNKRDSLQSNLWHKSSHPCRSGNHQPQEGVF